MPTVLDLCDVEAPPTVGRSWAPLLRGEAETCHERVYTTFNGENWQIPSHITVTTPTHTALFGRAPHEPELHDRTSDPDQLTNQAGREPDLVASLRADLVAFMRQQGASDDYIERYVLGRQ